eukprot:2347158-Prorocentrum_lima.AAC.1
MEFELSDDGTDGGEAAASEEPYYEVLDKNCRLFKWDGYRDAPFPTTNKRMMTTVNPHARPNLRNFYNFLKGFKCPYGDVRKALDRGCEQWLHYPSDVMRKPFPGTGVLGAQEAVNAVMGAG